jgi:drug/metabolite transporter (DMT)-like permease
MTKNSATLVGLLAIMMWSWLAALTVATGRVPAFQLAAMTFAIGACVGPLTWLWRPGAFRALRQPPLVWLVGVGGLFGYHALYFLALRLAPPAEAGLLNYLWPLLIVLFSALLPGEKLAAHHVLGGLLGLGGTALLLVGGHGAEYGAELASANITGFAAAFCAAFVWAGYSVLSRRLAAVPTDAVGGFCFVTAVLAVVCHLAFETTVWPQTPTQWLCIAALGLGPVGAAFYAWDVGMKHGDIRLLGVLSYATPLLSTGFLILVGFAQPTPTLALAALLITGGGLMAARDFLRARRPAARVVER